MKKVFTNHDHMTCIFDDEGVSLYGKHKEGFYPYGCMDSIHMTLLGEMQITFGFAIVSFVPEKEDRPAIRELVKTAKQLKKAAPQEEAHIYVKCSKVSDDLSREEQLKEFKNLFVTGTISKGYYDLKKRLLKD